MRAVTRTAEPSHGQRLSVVVVVLDRFLDAAFLARHWGQLAASLVRVRVGARISAAALRLGQFGVLWARVAHVTRVALVAVAGGHGVGLIAPAGVRHLADGAASLFHVSSPFVAVEQ